MWKQLILSARPRQGVIAGVLGGLLAVVLLAQTMSPAAQAKTAPAHLAMSGTQITQPGSFADLVEAVKPAVVNISTARTSVLRQFHRGPQFDVPPDSPFQEFFERFFEHPDSGLNEPQTQPRHAEGSGFIVDPSGYVVTNYHVIKGADEITVVTNEDKRYPARLQGHDSKTDLAVLKIDAQMSFPYVEFGDSEQARVGDWVVAIGNPFGLGGTATTGIISARGRDIRSGPLDDFLQIDAPINRGNSGGPLFAANGKVIGVNAAIFSPNGGNVGIGFAIPAAMAKAVVEELIHKGRVDRGWLGVQIQTLSEDIAETLGLDNPEGALVAGVMNNSPAAQAGLRVGDVILRFAGQSVTRMRDLPRMVASVPAEREVEIEIWRQGDKQTLTVTIGANPGDEEVAAVVPPVRDGKPELGLSLVRLTIESRRQYRVSETTDGVLVVDVKPNSPAARKGISPGDVIKKVGNEDVRTPSDVAKAVQAAAQAKRGAVLLLLERRGTDRFVALRLT